MVHTPSTSQVLLRSNCNRHVCLNVRTYKTYKPRYSRTETFSVVSTEESHSLPYRTVSLTDLINYNIARTVKSIFEGNTVSILGAILWLLILGLRGDQGCKDNRMVPLLLVLAHGTNTICSPVYTTIRKMDKFSISATFSHGKVSHFKGWKWWLTFRSCWACLLEVTLSWHSPLGQPQPCCLSPLLAPVAVLSTLDFIQAAKCRSCSVVTL